MWRIYLIRDMNSQRGIQMPVVQVTMICEVGRGATEAQKNKECCFISPCLGSKQFLLNCNILSIYNVILLEGEKYMLPTEN